jgi:uncharacterized Ntn-hydrolase superfamily protein
VTYSIVARDPDTGELGVAVQSRAFGTGRAVMWAQSQVGAVATQAFAEKSYGPLGLELMAAGLSPEKALAELCEADELRESRQVAFLAPDGRTAAHTGSDCIPECGHLAGDGFSAQGNMLRSTEVWPAMAEAFSTVNGTLAERLLDALDAAEAAGGDFRGRQAGGLLVVPGESTGKPWDDPCTTCASKIIRNRSSSCGASTGWRRPTAGATGSARARRSRRRWKQLARRAFPKTTWPSPERSPRPSQEITIGQRRSSPHWSPPTAGGSRPSTATSGSATCRRTSSLDSFRRRPTGYASVTDLYQAEWCPHSHLVRQRLTELALDFQARQVPADPDDRSELQLVAGTSEIPVLVPAPGKAPICGEQEILSYLDRFEAGPHADEHRAKAREEVPGFAEVKKAA